ncbi:DUF4194 domain-containing protein [Dictyobacter kobayashii]|uniref:DUF4194 domain-containing protein n=1 Tax=Dictyobacter kobayashii TaxID=2014872 RepID=A0A402ASZ6_9CHLR|nr:DUF4194 domain-containing protein [Dictyobacter kobayashii]GCE22224.1 hypothetical protein KDK_60240 [Dictyobacter kobayashii]
MKSNTVVAYAPVIIKLLQGPLFSDEPNSWNLLLHYVEQIQAYFAQIGLEVQLHEEDGFAYLHQPTIEDDDGHSYVLPRLTRRDRLNYHTTLLCVLLREQLDQFESSNLDSGSCLLTRKQLYDLLFPFLPERSNQLVMYKKMDATISTVIELGFLKRITSQTDSEYFEIRRLVKARVNAERLLEIKEKLQRYGTPLSETTDA